MKRVAYKVSGLLYEDLVIFLKKNFLILFIAGSGKELEIDNWVAFFFRRKYWNPKKKFSSKIFVAVIKSSAVYVDREYSGMSRTLSRNGIKFIRNIGPIPQEIEDKIFKTENRLRTSKY